MKQQLVKLFEAIIWVAFALFVIAGIALGAALGGGHRGPSPHGLFFGFLGGVTVGAVVTGFCMTLLSINEHLAAIRNALGGTAAEPASRSGSASRPAESRRDPGYHYMDANNQAQGPVPLDSLRDKVDRGEISPQTWVARPGDKEWTSLKTLLGPS